MNTRSNGSAAPTALRNVVAVHRCTVAPSSRRAVMFSCSTRGCPPVGLDEHRRRGSPRQRLQADRSGTRVQVQHPGPGQVQLAAQRVEQRLAGPLGGGTGDPRRHCQPPATRLATHDARHGCKRSAGPRRRRAGNSRASEQRLPAVSPGRYEWWTSSEDRHATGRIVARWLAVADAGPVAQEPDPPSFVVLPAEYDQPSLAGSGEPGPARPVLPGRLTGLARHRWVRWAVTALACVVAGGFVLVAVTSERNAAQVVRRRPPSHRPRR